MGTRPARPAWIRLLRVMRWPAVVYAAVTIAMAACQRRLLYFPRTCTLTEATVAATASGMEAWRNPGGQIIGWKHAAASQPAEASVLIIHGNAGCALERDYLARPIHEAARADVYELEYPGYGPRTGSPKRATLTAAAIEAFDLLPANRPRYVVSESIGAGPACELIQARREQVAGAAMFVPFHRLSWVAQRKFPILPVGLFLLDRFAPIDALADYRGPIRFVIAGNDEVIPPESGRRLYDAYAGPKELLVVPGAGHNDVASQAVDWWKETFTFWRNGRH